MKYFTYKLNLLTLLLFIRATISFSQELEHIPPVMKSKDSLNDSSISFLFAATNFHHTLHGYSNCIEVIDAAAPWPPRWYMSVPVNEYNSTGAAPGVNIVCEARFQNGRFSFYRERPALLQKTGLLTGVDGFVICDSKLCAVDTLKGSAGAAINAHDFRINAEKERIVMAILDTLLDMRNLSGNPADSNVSASITLIEIFDSTDKLLFRWNSAKTLGTNSVYYPYLSNTHTYFNRTNLDWSHGNSVLWDTDGNILYSFRYVGIGKISRKDGHVIWRIDRKDMPFISGSDTIEFYSQHDLEYISDSGSFETYSLISNGDDEHPATNALIFSVDKQTSKVKMIGKKFPAENVLSRGGGSFETGKNDDQVLSYGHYPMDDTSQHDHFFMEYRNKNGHLYARYTLPYFVFNDKVHELIDWRPPRPIISRKKNILTAIGEMTGWIWYELKGPGNAFVSKAGEGASFFPKSNGIYCVTGKYGIGYSVSLPVLFVK